MTPTLSLVICTRNRAAQLERCLASLRALHCSVPWELVIVDNGSIDDTQGRIEQSRALLPCTLTVLTEMTPGLGRARNRGWRAASGDIIAFTDDDCYPDATFLEDVIKAFEGRPSLGFVGGRILLYDATDYRITIQERNTRKDLPAKSFIAPGLIQGANISFRRKAIESVDGFDDIFGAGALFPCEDVDILARMSAVGWEGAYDPKPAVYHHHGRKTEADAQRLMKQYDRGRGAFYAKGLLNPAICGVTFKNWLWQIRHQAYRITARELAAAVEYWVRRALSVFNK